MVNGLRTAYTAVNLSIAVVKAVAVRAAAALEAANFVSNPALVAVTLAR